LDRSGRAIIPNKRRRSTEKVTEKKEKKEKKRKRKKEKLIIYLPNRIDENYKNPINFSVTFSVLLLFSVAGSRSEP